MLTRIHFIQGDVANPQKPVGAVVNAANNQLQNGSGVCGAIYGQAGAGLDDEIKSLKAEGTVPEKIDNGSAVITHSHNIKNAGAIIHTPGPDLRGIMNQPIRPYYELASSYGASIALAHKNGLQSVAFPSISTGIFEFPAEIAPIIAVYTVVKALQEYKDMEVYFVVWPGAKNFDKVMEKLN